MSMKEEKLLSKGYEFAEVKKMAARWRDRCFPPPWNRETSFSIVIPLPNVTGVLHVGHALNNTLQISSPAITACAAITPCGFRGPTMPVSPRKTSPNGSLPEGKTRDDWPRGLYRRVWAWREKGGRSSTS
jgi:valyl-tRNA synthetase